jgi:hypothetical protein
MLGNKKRQVEASFPRNEWDQYSETNYNPLDLLPSSGERVRDTYSAGFVVKS